MTNIFPETWGKPPAFSATQVSPEGQARQIHPNVHPNSPCADNSQKACTLGPGPVTAGAPATGAPATGAPIDEDVEASPDLRVYTVDGCPSASSELLVKEGEYEGGFAIWECTWDMLGFLQQKEGNCFAAIQRSVASGHALELGCGHGLLGIWALQNGASAVVFQDLNDRVLQGATRWNILRNFKEKHRDHSDDRQPRFCHLSSLFLASREEEISPLDIEKEALIAADDQQRFSLLDGSVLCLTAAWEKFPALFCSCKKAFNEEIQYHLIFCAEGIYREQTFAPLANLFVRLLTPDGLALVASKRYYFGVGGGSLAFLLFLREKFLAQLEVEVVKTFKGSNSNNFRDILFIRKR